MFIGAQQPPLKLDIERDAFSELELEQEILMDAECKPSVEIDRYAFLLLPLPRYSGDRTRNQFVGISHGRVQVWLMIHKITGRDNMSSASANPLFDQNI